ncbi:MAG: hypothetical protein LBG47_10620 [Prevotellaceae bacterium]|jgi:hypothetical protein|nr:hypothetical protein [Prevotellaceae bacterium]
MKPKNVKPDIQRLYTLLEQVTSIMRKLNSHALHSVTFKDHKLHIEGYYTLDAVNIISTAYRNMYWCTPYEHKGATLHDAELPHLSFTLTQHASPPAGHSQHSSTTARTGYTKTSPCERRNT